MAKRKEPSSKNKPGPSQKKLKKVTKPKKTKLKNPYQEFEKNFKASVNVVLQDVDRRKEEFITIEKDKDSVEAWINEFVAKEPWTWPELLEYLCPKDVWMMMAGTGQSVTEKWVRENRMNDHLSMEEVVLKLALEHDTEMRESWYSYARILKKIDREIEAQLQEEKKAEMVKRNKETYTDLKDWGDTILTVIKQLSEIGTFALASWHHLAHAELDISKCSRLYKRRCNYIINLRPPKDMESRHNRRRERYTELGLKVNSAAPHDTIEVVQREWEVDCGKTLKTPKWKESGFFAIPVKKVETALAICCERRTCLLELLPTDLTSIVQGYFRPPILHGRDHSEKWFDSLEKWNGNVVKK